MAELEADVDGAVGIYVSGWRRSGAGWQCSRSNVGSESTFHHS